ncbi:MAG: hypothetical protein JWR26_1161 [Pedosphaera sp.]|nr:hypothetical protein [Pedosphaera sp.]
MSDDKSLEILITTKAELDGAAAAEAQLQQDIDKARELGEAYEELEARLQSVRRAIADYAGTGDESQSPEETRDAATHPGDKPARSSKAGSENIPSAAGAVSRLVETIRDVFQEALDAHGRNGGAAERPVEPGGNNGFVPAPTTPPVPAWSENQGVPEASSVNAPERDSNEPAVAGVPQTRRTSPSVPQLETGEDIAQAVVGQAQAIQTSGETLRAALALNHDVTIEIFNRTLQLIGQQNQQLREVDRKVSELSGQIKSLKNP